MNTYYELFKTFFKLGAFAVGGGYSMIPLIKKEVVHIHKWIKEDKFNNIVSIDAITPGSIAINLATFIGYEVKHILGAIIAILGLLLPSVSIVLILSYLLIQNEIYTNKYIQSTIYILRPIAISLIVISLLELTIHSKYNRDITQYLFIICIFTLIYIFKVDFYILIIVSILLSLLYTFLFIK